MACSCAHHGVTKCAPSQPLSTHSATHLRNNEVLQHQAGDAGQPGARWQHQIADAVDMQAEQRCERGALQQTGLGRVLQHQLLHGRKLLPGHNHVT